ncbi:hypothetical protein PHYPSEUDO_005661 [Phytophthora pseudosyringae]|uniref:Uncharacterized protein n=1 Tax=Phytophthora pseudosyringae TaxID=221518 RepID=A0A8T1VNN0_9STRA|nr:hypothetical protein PHYPSEUDO_005661 [Phytophthora pseudosyringae]
MLFGSIAAAKRRDALQADPLASRHAQHTFSDATAHAPNATTRSLSMVTPTASDPVARRLVEGLQCDLDLYNAFIESDEGQDTFIMAALCESRIVYLKNARAGWYGPVPQADLLSAMCSDECLRSDELHKKAMSLSRCTCAEVSAETFVRHDFCLEGSARLLCTHLSECGHWGCQLEDFNCLRYEWDHLYPCASSCEAMSVVVTVLALAATSWLA